MATGTAARAGWLLFGTSGALILGALWFQFGQGLAPCEMCFWQRYVHLGVMLLAALAILSRRAAIAWLAVLAMLGSAGLGLFHAGVEQKWWDGPTQCSGGLPQGASAADMIGQMMAGPLVRCDAIAWSFAGVSMAGWNAIISLLAALAAGILIARRS